MKYNTNGGLIAGAPTTTRYILYGKKTPLLSDLSLEHYEFKGWYDEPDEGNIFNSNAVIITQIIIYAQWTNKQYRVSFESDSGSDTVMVKSLTPITHKPVYSLEEHYVFDGWYFPHLDQCYLLK